MTSTSNSWAGLLTSGSQCIVKWTTTLTIVCIPYDDRALVHSWFFAIGVTGHVLLQAITMYTMTNLLPYVGYMVAGFRGDHADGAGYEAGYVASSFFLGRLLSSYVWGFASDRLGRKPVMVISLGSIVIGSIFFGVSKGLVWAISVRFLMGLTNAATVVGRAIVPELCGSAGVVGGMGLVTGGYAIGMTLGPAFGGLLSEPSRNFPSLSSPDGLFARYPYVLPNVVGSLVALILMPLVILYVPETKKRNSCPEGQFPGYRPVTPVSTPTRMRDEGRGYDMLAAGAGTKTPRSRQKVGVSPLLVAHGTPVASSMKEMEVTVEDKNKNEADSQVVELEESKIFGGLLQVRHVPGLLLATGLMEVSWFFDTSAAAVQIVVVGFEEVYPLWTISSRRAGGLNWDIIRIGQVLFCAGVGQAVLMFVAHAWLVKWMGVEECHRCAGALAALLNAAVPLIGYLRWSDTAIFILSSVTIAVLSAASTMVYSAVMVSATNPAPPRLRGRLAGITTAAQCLGGVLGPGTFAVLFAWSISRTSTARDIPFVNQHFVFNVGAILRIVLVALVWKSLSEESLTDVVEDPPTPRTIRAPPTELETVRNGEGVKHESLSLSIGDKRSDLV